MSDVDTLWARASECAEAAGVRLKDWERFIDKIESLQDHNEFHFKHSLRVGIYAYSLANYEGQRDLKFPLFAGCAHDIGKCDIGNDVLNHPEFGPEQYEIVKAHPRLGFDTLYDDFMFSSFIAGLHHAFQPNGYGIDPDTDLPSWLPDETRELVLRMARFIMLVDFFDALTTRGARGGSDPQGIMLDRFEDQRDRVDWLFAHQMEE